VLVVSRRRFTPRRIRLADTTAGRTAWWRTSGYPLLIWWGDLELDEVTERHHRGRRYVWRRS
jgi:hypothetical protein